MDDITDIVGYALNAPLELGWGLLKGGALLLFFFLIIPLFTAVGYTMRLIRQVATEGTIPEVGDLGDLTVEGFKAALILFPAFLLQAIIAQSPRLVIGENIAVLLSQGINFILGALFVAIMVEYAVTRDWKGAYSPDSIMSYVTDTDYLLMYVVFAVMNVVVGIAAIILSALSFITILGWIILIPSIYFGTMVVSGAFLGKMYDSLQQG